MVKQIQQRSDIKGTLLSACTAVSLITIPIVWKMPNILPLVVTGGFASSMIYHKKIGYTPSKLEKQFIETQQKLNQELATLEVEKQNLETKKANLDTSFYEWREKELLKLEQIRIEKIKDAQEIIDNRRKEVEELAKTNKVQNDARLAQQNKEFERRQQELLDREALLEQRALAVGKQLEETEKQNIKRVEERDALGIAELEQKANQLELYRQQLESDRQKLEEEKAQLVKEVQEVERQWEEKWLEQEARHQEDYKQLEVVYTNVAGTYAAENWALKRPDYFDPPTNTEEYAANDVMKLLSQSDIFAKAPILKSDDRGFRLSFKVLPVKHKVRGEEIPEKTLSAGEAYKLINTKLLPDLAATVPGCETPPIVKPNYQGIELYFDTTGVDWEDIQPKSGNAIHETDKNIFDMFASTYHIALEGATGRGKTTTTKNVLNAMLQELGHENVTIKVAAGKPDEGLREFDTVVSPQKVMLRLKEAADLVEQRIATHNKDWETGKPLTKFDKKFIFFFDEISDLATWCDSGDPEIKDFFIDNDFPIDKNGEPVKKMIAVLLNRCLRLGRSLGIMMLIAGQNLNPSIFGMQTKDMENMGWVYCGGTAARRGIDTNALRIEKNYWFKQYALRIQEGQEFFAFFVSGSGDSWLSNIPLHGWNKFATVGSHTGQEVKEGQVRSDHKPHPEVDSPTNNVGGQQPYWDEVKRKLEESLSMSGEVEGGGGYDLKLMPWKPDSDPKKLVQSAIPQIQSLVKEGVTNPKQIAMRIWGDVVNPQAKPYNLKGGKGVKSLIEQVVKEIEKK